MKKYRLSYTIININSDLKYTIYLKTSFQNIENSCTKRTNYSKKDDFSILKRLICHKTLSFNKYFNIFVASNFHG
jgi:hypothetical protein